MNQSLGETSTMSSLHLMVSNLALGLMVIQTACFLHKDTENINPRYFLYSVPSVSIHCSILIIFCLYPPPPISPQYSNPGQKVDGLLQYGLWSSYHHNHSEVKVRFLQVELTIYSCLTFLSTVQYCGLKRTVKNNNHKNTLKYQDAKY